MFRKLFQSPLLPRPRVAWLAAALAGLVAIVALFAPAPFPGSAPAYAAPSAQQPARAAAPSDFAVTRAVGATSATARWTPAAGAEVYWVFAIQQLDPDEPNPQGHGVIPDTYHIVGRDLPGDAATLEITDLHPGRAYAYGITTRSGSAAGAELWSDWQIYRPPAAERNSCYDTGAVPDPADNPGLLSDCRVLLGLRDALQGDTTRPLDWSVTRPIAAWEGITVAETTPRVEVLRLERRRLAGVLPPALSQLDALRILGLGDNLLSGGIPPELGSMSSLAELALYKNDLEGVIPPELGNLSRLTTLILDGNHLGGEMPLPRELGQLANLERLWLTDNELVGSIPPELGDLSNLQSLRLGDNLLHGAIPKELGNLSNLQHMSLQDNHLDGAIPSELGRLTALTRLGLSNNRLRGSIPPELGQLTGLRQLLLDDNRLSGPIPPQLGNLPSVFLLYLNHNRLEGEIPPELGRLSSLAALLLNSNDLTGEIPPELGQLNLLTVRVANNHLTGCLPASWRSIRPDLTDARLTGLPYCDAETAPPPAPVPTPTPTPQP